MADSQKERGVLYRNEEHLKHAWESRKVGTWNQMGLRDGFPGDEAHCKWDYPEVTWKPVIWQELARQWYCECFLFLNGHLPRTSDVDNHVDVILTVKLRFEAFTTRFCVENETTSWVVVRNETVNHSLNLNEPQSNLQSDVNKTRLTNVPQDSVTDWCE